MAEDARRTDAGIEIKPLYTADDLAGWDPATQLGRPGEPPYTRGIYPSMYRGRLWTMRQYAGFGTAEATNQRFKFLLQAGQTGLSCLFAQCQYGLAIGALGQALLVGSPRFRSGGVYWGEIHAEGAPSAKLAFAEFIQQLAAFFDKYLAK